MSLDREWSTPECGDSEHVIIRPALGEIFIAADRIIYACEHEIFEITGDFAIGLFRNDHGLAVTDLSSEIRKRAIEYVIQNLKIIPGLSMNYNLVQNLCERRLRTTNLLEVNAALLNILIEEIADNLRMKIK